MMLHRHFEQEKTSENITTQKDLMPKPKFVSEVFPPDEKAAEAPKRRGGRPKKSVE